MENVGTAIVEVANEKGFDAPTMLGIARTETHFGTLASQESSPAKQTDINPTQLSSTSGMQPTTDLKKNIEGSMVIYNRGLADTTNQGVIQGVRPAILAILIEALTRRSNPVHCDYLLRRKHHYHFNESLWIQFVSACA